MLESTWHPTQQRAQHTTIQSCLSSIQQKKVVQTNWQPSNWLTYELNALCASASVSLMLLLFDVKRLLFISSIAYHDIEIYDPNNSNLQAIHLVIVRLIHPGLSLSLSVQQNNCNENAANQLPLLTNIKHIFGFAVLLLCFSLSRSLSSFLLPPWTPFLCVPVNRTNLSISACVCMAMTKSVPVTTRQIILINPFINCRYCAKDGTTAQQH